MTEELRQEIKDLKRRVEKLEDPEGELTEQAQRELAKARAEPRSTYTKF